MAPQRLPSGVSSSPGRSVEIAGWVYDPNGRGTASLITSCVLTLGICVFSSLHLNIPPKNESRRQYWTRSFRWIVLGIFIPELVVLAAWRQWTSARRLNSQVNNIFEESEPCARSSQTPSNTSEKGRTDLPKPTWTVLHSYYAGMGGFAFDPGPFDSNESIFPQNVTRLTLTTHGVVLLARCGLLPDVDPNDLLDKSKSDGLAKAIVVLQAGWMMGQTIARLCYRLPVSLLEVNTVGHVFCAFIVYILWWGKPREVYEPTILKGDWTRTLTAYMYMSSRISGNVKRPWFKPESWVRPELANLVYVAPSQPLDSQISVEDVREDGCCGNTEESSRPIGRFCRRPRCGGTQGTVSTNQTGRWTLNSDTEVHEQAKSCAKSHEGGVDVTETTEAYTGATNGEADLWNKPLPNIPASVYEDACRQRRYVLAAEAIESYTSIRDRFQEVNTRHGEVLLEPEITQLVVPAAGNWPADHLTGRMRGQLMGMCLWFASMIYGGVHIAAWHEYFPSHAEQFMWRLSSVYIASSGFFWFLLNVFAFLCPWAAEWFRTYRQAKVHWLQLVPIGFGATVCGLMYIFARTFLVIDAIVSLRKVPAEVYKTPSWAGTIPHL